MVLVTSTEATIYPSDISTTVLRFSS